MQQMLGYLRALAAVSFLAAAVRALLPEKSYGRIIGYTCGLLILTVSVRPLVTIDARDIAEAIGKLEIRSVENRTGLIIDNETIISDIIKEKTEAYIFDKAAQLQIPLRSVSVTMEKGGEYSYPAAVLLSGHYTQQQRTELSKWIEINLAIPIAEQTWEVE